MAKKKDWSVYGLGEKEMKSRIKSHTAMRDKARERMVNNEIPEAFLSPDFKMWVKNNPNSQWLQGDGPSVLMDQAERHFDGMRRAIKHDNVVERLKKQQQLNKQIKLRNKIKKITRGY
tara:strand:+ start:496 stop:849 length:354 start_codon:yes stop_codon:yes gene_type:complete